MKPNPNSMLSLVAAAAAIMIAGCGGGDDDSAATPPPFPARHHTVTHRIAAPAPPRSCLDVTTTAPAYAARPTATTAANGAYTLTVVETDARRTPCSPRPPPSHGRCRLRPRRRPFTLAAPAGTRGDHPFRRSHPVVARQRPAPNVQPAQETLLTNLVGSPATSAAHGLFVVI